MMRSTLLMLGWLSASACAGLSTPPPDEPIAEAVEPEALDEATLPPRPDELPTLDGDDRLEEPWRARFRTWLAEQEAPTYAELTDVDVIANAATVVLRRRIEADDECREGPTRLTLIYDDGAPPQAERVDFGDDCCPGTTCVRTPSSWNLRYQQAVAEKDAAALAALLPTKRPLVWRAVAATEDAADDTTRSVTRASLTKGEFPELPGCNVLHATPACAEPSRDGFTCTCDAGGYHVEYTWKTNGADFSLVTIEEQSH